MKPIKKLLTTPNFVARDEYGYAIITAIALAVCALGLYFVINEQQKRVEDRSPSKIINGIIIASCGSVILILAILYLMTRR